MTDLLINKSRFEKNNVMKPTKLPFYAHLSLVLVAIFVMILLLKIGSVVFIPLFFALLISVCLFPLTRRLENMRFPRGLAALTSMILFMGTVGLFMYFLIIQIIHFSEDFPTVPAAHNIAVIGFSKFHNKEISYKCQ
jgi:predicted PurR-regulated permease PerM